MATYLVFDSNSMVYIDPIALGADFEFEVKLKNLASASSEQWVISFWDDTSSDRAFAMRIKSGQLQTYFSPDGSTTNNGPTIAITTGVDYQINVGKRGSTAFLSLNGGAESTTTVASSALHVPLSDPAIGGKNIGFGTYKLNAEVESVKLTNNSAASNFWESASSDTSNTGLQPVWADTIGNNDGRGDGFPTDGTAWSGDPGVPGSGGGGSGAISIETQDYSFRKAQGASAVHTVSGTYTGTPTAIEYQIDSGAWAVGDASPAGDVFSFNVTIPIGESVVSVRFANETATTASVTLVTPALIVACSGQSNMSGRGLNNQTYTQAGGVKAYLYGNDENFKLLQDPYDSSINQVFSSSSDNSAGGSWIVRFAHYWIESQGTPIAFIPCAKGGTSISNWASNGYLYPQMIERCNDIGGVDVVFWQLGETDSETGTTVSDFTTRLNTLANDVNTDLSVELFIVPLHTITAAGFDGDGVTTGQVALRQAQIDVASTNSNVRIGQPLTDIDISDQDGLHFRADDELDLVASRMYDSYTGVISTLSISITGSIPDGSYTVTLTDPNDSMSNIYSGSTTITNGSIVIPDLSYPASTTITGYLLGNGDPQTKGIVIRGVTA